jgi:hypothetical protein
MVRLGCALGCWPRQERIKLGSWPGCGAALETKQADAGKQASGQQEQRGGKIHFPLTIFANSIFQMIFKSM